LAPERLQKAEVDWRELTIAEYTFSLLKGDVLMETSRRQKRPANIFWLFA